MTTATGATVPDAYDEVVDQEAGEDNADLEPLIEFLEFINDSDDVTFADEIVEWFDVDAVATAAQRLTNDRTGSS